MHRLFTACALLAVATAAGASPDVRQAKAMPANAVLRTMGSQGLRFEPNLGQTDPRVKFLARLGGATLFVTRDEAVLRLSGTRPMPEDLMPGPRLARKRQTPPEPDRVIRTRLVGASRSSQAFGMGRLPGVSNYFIGNDPSKWRRNIPSFAKAKLTNVYPKTDLVYYDSGGRLEYDFILKPGADPKRIAMQIQGADRMRVAGGDLVLRAGSREIRWRKPVAYRMVGGRRVAVACRYEVQGTLVRFRVARHDPTQTLVVDPVMEWSTMVGGAGNDGGSDVHPTSDGGCIVAGWCSSLAYPRFGTQFGQQPRPGVDAAILRFGPHGSIEWAGTFGGDGDDSALGVTQRRTGEIVAVGYTTSTSFPTTAGSAFPNPLVLSCIVPR